MSEAPRLDLPNVRYPLPGVCSGGRPSPEDFASAARQGTRTVINLCPPSEPCPYDEPTLVASLGMRYVNIPVAGAAGLTRENVEALDSALRESGKTLLHCASGNRIGALLALKACWIDDHPSWKALQIGIDGGLTALEPAVRVLLGLPA